MVTPPGWRNLDLSQATSGESLGWLVGNGASHTVEALIDGARSQGASMGAVYIAQVGETRIAASMIAAVRPADDRVTRDGSVDVDALHSLLATGGRRVPASDVSVVDLPSGRAVRVRARPEVVVGNRVARAANVQYFLRVPDQEAILVVTFSTPTIELAEAFGELFEAIAASVEWVD
jgi:hypothetical protein